MGVPPVHACATLQQDVFPKKPLWIYDGGTDCILVKDFSVNGSAVCNIASMSLT